MFNHSTICGPLIVRELTLLSSKYGKFTPAEIRSVAFLVIHTHQGMNNEPSCYSEYKRQMVQWQLVTWQRMNVLMTAAASADNKSTLGVIFVSEKHRKLFML